MKTLLVIVNILLAAAVVWEGVRFFKNLSPAQPKAGFTVKKRDRKNKMPNAGHKNENKQESVSVSTENQVKQIVEANIFNPERCPNAGVWGGNARVEMTLVGTFRIGTARGAVILQKTQSRNFPFMPFGGMMNNQAGMQQRRQGIGRGSLPMRQDSSGNIRRQIGGNRSIQAGRTAQGNPLPGQNASANSGGTVTYKQYVRLGETMANGYKLTEVDRKRVVLTRGSDKLELELADPSVNAKQTARRTRPANQTQIMQQMLQSMQNMQRAQMMQGFQMMRMNQQNMQNMQNPQGGRGGMVPFRR